MQISFFVKLIANVILVSMVFAGFATIILEIQRVRRLRAWPRTSGRVTTARVTSSKEIVTEDSGLGSMYGCEIDYEYTVGGSTYARSEQLTGIRTADAARAQDLCEKYQTVDDLVIAYNPANPTHALIAGGTSDEVRMGTILGGIAFIAFALVFMLILISVT